MVGTGMVERSELEKIIFVECLTIFISCTELQIRTGFFVHICLYF